MISARSAPDAIARGHFLGHAAYGGGGAGEQDRRGTLELFEPHGLARDEAGHLPGVPLHAPVGRNCAEGADVVVSEVSSVVVGFGEHDGLLSQDVTQGTEMQRFGIGDDAVEIEDDGADHQAFSLMRSPARMAICS